jgi:NAD(P)-dependent dehydrogenase (short-subunit alcohol dehydrogenase family)
MDLELADKIAVVTGANKGIALAITKALMAEGACVVAGSLSTENLRGIERVTPVAVNLMATDGPAVLVRKAIEKHGRLDVLVNNVGAVRSRLNGFLGTSDEEFEWAFQRSDRRASA